MSESAGTPGDQRYSSGQVDTTHVALPPRSRNLVRHPELMGVGTVSRVT